MIKVLTIFSFVIACSVSMMGQALISGNAGITGPANITTDQVFLVVDRFEEINTGGAIPSLTDGYDSLLITTTNGTINPDATDRNIGDGGFQSFKIDASAGNGFIRYVFATSTELFVDFKYQLDALPASTSFNVISIRDASGNIQAQVAIQTDGRVRAYKGSSFGLTTDAVVVDTNYYFRLHWKAGSLTEFGFSTTFPPTMSGNSYCTTTSVDGNTTAPRLQFGGESGVIVWFDDLFVSNEKYRQ